MGAWSLVLGAFVGGIPAQAQESRSPAAEVLRAELTRLLQTDGAEAAIRHAQAALAKRPDDPGVRAEFAELHLALAREWYREQRLEASLAAAEAILRLEPDHAEAVDLRAEILDARRRAERAAGEADRLLRLELFEAALDQVRAIQALRPELAGSLEPAAQAAWLGAADDHYLARNFNEAFALYEHYLATHPDAAADVHSRWALSLALAITEDQRAGNWEPNTAARLLARAVDVLHGTNEPVIGQILGGLLAECAGNTLDAGRTYAAALGKPWSVPPADRRNETVAELRSEATRRLQALYERTPTQRREGRWSLALPDVWKSRKTANFEVFARNDLVARDVAEALEYHLAGLAAWLGVPDADLGDAPCEVRVYATMEELHAATESGGVTRAVSRSRVQGGQVLSRKIEVFQSDPWLLSSTLPHELTHVLLSKIAPAGTLPLAIDEGLALQAEPPARRLQFRRLLRGVPPDPGQLLAARQVPGDTLNFYADCDALTDMLLTAAAARTDVSSDPAARATVQVDRGLPPVARVVHSFRDGLRPQWWTAFAWRSREEMHAGWKIWYDRRRSPARMPLMILKAPAAELATEPAGRLAP